MSLFNIFVVIGLILVLLILLGIYTTGKFNSVESGEINDRKHIDKEMQSNDKEGTEQR